MSLGRCMIMVNCAGPVDLSWQMISQAIQNVVEACIEGRGVAGVGSLSTCCLSTSSPAGSASVIDYLREFCPVVGQHHRCRERDELCNDDAKNIARLRSLHF